MQNDVGVDGGQVEVECQDKGDQQVNGIVFKLSGRWVFDQVKDV